MTRKKPWNRTDQPVYSISSKSGQNQNMHIITYVTGVSMQPKRFICAVFNHTQTLENISATGEFVLQLLSSEQYRLADLLGKKSGKQVNKIKRLQKRNLLTEWKGYKILQNCLAVMHLKSIQHFDAGDHVCFLCDVADWKNMNDGNPLTLNILREKNMIRM